MKALAAVSVSKERRVWIVTVLSWSTKACQLDVGFTTGDHFDSLRGAPGKNGVLVIEYGMIDNYLRFMRRCLRCS